MRVSRAGSIFLPGKRASARRQPVAAAQRSADSL